MRSLFLTSLISAAFLGNAMAQETWKNYFRSGEMEINFRYAECHDPANGVHKSLVLLQFVNLTGSDLSVGFNKQLWYDNGKCLGCDNSPEQHFGVRLAPNQTLAGSCDDTKTKSLYIFDKMLNVKSSALEKFELADVKISKAQ